MRRWLILSLAIVVLLIIGGWFVARVIFPPPIPDPPVVADAPADFHLNEIDLAASSAMLISIENLTDSLLTIDLQALGQEVAKGLRLFHPLGDEWKWIDLEGRTARLTLDASTLQTGMGWQPQTTLTIEPGRSESALLAVDPMIRPVPVNWAARLRLKPPRLVYVLDFNLPLVDRATGAPSTARITAKGEAAYLPRP